MDIVWLCKYGSILLTLLLAMLPLLTKTTTADGALTRWGWVLVVATILSAAMVLIMTWYEDESVRIAEIQKAAEERERLRKIIVSSQPLRSMKMRWTFSNVPAAARTADPTADHSWKYIHDNEEIPEGRAYDRMLVIEHENGEEYRMNNVYPWISSLATGKWGVPDDALMLISLDESQSIVLPLGTVSHAESLADAAPSIDLLSDLRRFFAGQGGGPTGRNRQCRLDMTLERNGSHVIFEWQLDPEALLTCVDRVMPDLHPTAAMPSKMRIVILTDVLAESIMFSNVTKYEVPGGQPRRNVPYIPWDPSSSNRQVSEPLGPSVLEIWPNCRSDYSVKYQMRQIMPQGEVNANYWWNYRDAMFKATAWEGIPTEPIQDSANNVGAEQASS